MSIQPSRKTNIDVQTQVTIKLNDNRQMPQLGFGVWQIPDEEAAKIAGEAIAIGYRSIDTAAIYENESGVGKAILKSGIAREDLFITTKLWNDRQGYDSTLKAFDESLKRLKLDYVDLYLIHWPMPRVGKFVETWRTFIRLKEEGRAKSIGVSNFNIPHIERLIGETGIVPAVNQVELHPYFQQKELRAFHMRQGIATESWSPLGRGKLLQNPVISAIAKKHGKTPAQIVIRWHLDSELIVIPKSATFSRIAENFSVFNFRLDDEDMRKIDALDSRGGRIGPDPEVLS